MLFQFPYTNLYNLNLDWMIKAMKEMQEIVEPLDRVVNSVNNMTGDVVLTKAFLLNILESMVSKFNGRAGDVTLTAADVNGTMIDITWTSDPGDVIGDLAQNVRDQLYAIGKRVLIFVNNQGVPDQIYFLTLVGDVVTPQIYSPTAALAGVVSFNGQTGAVTATGSDLDTANDNDTPISESIENLQSAVVQQSQQIGNIPLPTTAQTLTGAIKENSDKISDLGPVNNLTSDSTTAALSAAQGKALYDYILPYISTPTTSYHLTNITTISNAFTAGSVRILQLGKICVCIINWLIGSAIPKGTLLTVPESLKPVSGITFDFGAGHGYFELTTNGDLVCYESPNDYGTWLNQSFTYFTR